MPKELIELRHLRLAKRRYVSGRNLVWSFCGFTPKGTYRRWRLIYNTVSRRFTTSVLQNKLEDEKWEQYHLALPDRIEVPPAFGATVTEILRAALTHDDLAECMRASILRENPP